MEKSYEIDKRSKSEEKKMYDESNVSPSRCSPNKILKLHDITEPEKKCMEHGYVCRDPKNISSYSIKWPVPTSMTVFVIRKPHEPTIDPWADKIIAYFFIV